MIIDMHNHAIPPSAVTAIKASPELYGARIEDKPEEPTVYFTDSMQQYAGVMTPAVFAALGDLEKSKAHLKAIGADGAIASMYISWHRYQLPSEQGIGLARLLNDSIAEWVHGEPTFRAMATLPLQDGQAAADELRRGVKDLGLVGAMIVTNMGDDKTSLEAEHLEPLWAAAEELDKPIFLHPTHVAGRPRLSGWALENLLGNPFDTTIAASSLILSGVLDRHPGLKVVLSHGGGYLPMAFARLTHGYNHNPTTRKTALQEPEAYLRRFWYDTILFHPAPLKYLIDLVGADRVVLGTDYPFNMEPVEPVRMIEALEIAKEESQKILGNAAELYGFV